MTTKCRKMRWAGTAARMEKMRHSEYKIMVRNPEEQRQLGRPRREDNIKEQTLTK
jgi:hypothetical protein